MTALYCVPPAPEIRFERHPVFGEFHCGWARFEVDDSTIGAALIGQDDLAFFSLPVQLLHGPFGNLARRWLV